MKSGSDHVVTNEILEQVSGGSVTELWLCLNPKCTQYFIVLPQGTPRGRCKVCGKPLGSKSEYVPEPLHIPETH